MSRRPVLTVALVSLAAGTAGFALGAVNAGPARTPAPAVPVHVAVVLEESGEVRSVELTDDNGEDVPVGSIAEEFPWLEEEGE